MVNSPRSEEKWHLFVFDEKDTETLINFGPSVIKESNEERLLGVIIDQRLNFKQPFNMVL